VSQGKKYRVAVIPGDGIGKEVVPEGLRVLEAAAKKHGVDVHFDHFDFACWEYYEKHGQMMPDDWKDKIGKHDAIYFGAVGWPAKIPDHISPGAADARRAVAAGQPQARRYRFLGGARKYRR
jgi:tartrate dehydrogenase/decarboxylase/D-malate dehydrogenase